MKSQILLICIALTLLVLATFNLQLATAHAQGTAFTYQGRLNSGSGPASGLYDFRFKLFVDPLGNTQFGANDLTNGIAVTGGLFITTIDFGAGLFTGSNYWLEVDVRTNNPANTLAYIPLSPFQSLTPTPYAIFANSASNVLGGLSASQISGGILSQSVLPGFSSTYGYNSLLGGSGNAQYGGYFGVIAGGQGNLLVGINYDAIVGGESNLVFSTSGGFIGGGAYNNVSGQNGVISGGTYNTNAADYSFIGGGYGNVIYPSTYCVIGGGVENIIYGGIADTTIGGGALNSATGGASTIGGGQGNQTLGDFAMVGGGYENLANGLYSVITGGQNNTNSSRSGTIAGGQQNVANGQYQATVGGGYNNTASANYATVPGGYQNIAGGPVSFAGGTRAQALHQGAFVWADDSVGAVFSSTANNQFLIRAQGGMGINTAVTPDNYFSINTNVYLFSHVLYLRGEQGSDPNHGLAYNGNTVTNFGTGNYQVDGPALWGFSGGLLGTKNGGDHGALTWNTTGVTINGTLTGNATGLTNLSASQLTGDSHRNFAFGPSGNPSMTGSDNTAVGYSSLTANTTGTRNTADGNYALNSNTTGVFNTAGGSGALFGNTSGSYNTATGNGALAGNVSGSNNTAVGNVALTAITSGNNNIALGYGAGSSYTASESNNIVLGNVGVPGENNAIRIGTPGIQTQTYFAGVVNGNGGGLTSLNAGNLTGALPAISGANLTSLPANAALLGANQSFTGGNTFTSTTTVTNSGAVDSLNVYGTRTGGWPNPVAFFDNKSTALTASPALRVTVDGGAALDGALSVSANIPAGTANSILAEFGNNLSFVLVITNDGTMYCAGDVYARGTKLTSDRNAKENFTPLNTRTVLDKVLALPVTEWNYRNDAAATRHIGPVAQDFHSSFGLDGNDDRHISVVDEGGVALAAIQGLNEKVEGRSQQAESQIEALKAENADLKARLERLEQLIDQKVASAK